MKKVQVSFTEEQIKLLSHFNGTMGGSDAEVVRNIVLSWLSEKSIISKTAKDKMEKDGRLFYEK